jgi:hypothetical protein
VLKYIVSGDRQWKLNLRKLSRDESMLFHIGILSLVDEDANDDDPDRARLVSFTSGLIFRACIHSVFLSTKGNSTFYYTSRKGLKLCSPIST